MSDPASPALAQASPAPEHFMRLALAEAARAAEQGEVPVGAVVVLGDRVIARAHNERERAADPTAHAEVLALRRAATSLGHWRLTDTTMFVTLEPCPMCAGALINARVRTVYYGCGDPKAGAVRTLYNLLEDQRLNHRVSVVSGLLGDEAASLLKSFFARLRGET